MMERYENHPQQPRCCPFCGGEELFTRVAAWDAQSTEDPDNTTQLQEHQCLGACEGASFWS